MRMFSEELRILDRNTVKYMIEEQQKEIDSYKEQLQQKDEELNYKDKELNQKDKELNRKTEELGRKEMELQAAMERLAELELKLAGTGA